MNEEQKKAYEQFQNIDYRSFADWIFSLSGYEFAIIAASIGLVISSQLDYDRQESIANFFNTIGQMMLSVATQQRAKIGTIAKTRPLTAEEMAYLYGAIAPASYHDVEILKAQMYQIYNELNKPKR